MISLFWRTRLKILKPRPLIYQVRSYISDSSNNVHPDMNKLKKTTDFLHAQNILLQKYQQRLTKQKLLNEASGFCEKFKINTKWILIRGNRPFNIDEISTIFSWLIISQIVWIIVGTTTFVSLVLFTFNTVFAKEIVGKFVGKCLNRYIDECDIEFQDALVPEWRKGCIRFKLIHLKTNNSSEIFSFNLNFNQVDISLSLRKWFLGHGLIENLFIYGMNGDITTNQKDSPLINWFPNPEYHLGQVTIHDSCVILHDKTINQDYRISIYNMHLNKLRLKWFLTDFFDANVVTGAINHSLFSIHKRQHKLAYIYDFEHDLSPWKKIARLRLDSISVSDLGLDKSDSFNWISSGQVDITADIMLPHLKENENEPDEDNKYIVMDLKFKFKDLSAKLPSEAPHLSNKEILISLDELKPAITHINNRNAIFHSIMDIENSNYMWNNSTISINKQKSYPSITVIPSIVSWPDGEGEIHINKEIIKYHEEPNQNNEIVLRCRIVKNMQELKYTILFAETGIYDLLAMEMYIDLTKLIEEWEFKKKNDWMKLWGTTFASQLLVLGLGAMV